MRKEEKRENNKRTINTTLDPDVSMLITSGSITSVEDTRVRLKNAYNNEIRIIIHFEMREKVAVREGVEKVIYLHVSLEVPLVIAVDRASD